MDMVEYVRTDGRFGELFKSSMKEFNPIFMKRILEIYKGFEGLTSLVDVGGGDGTILNMIISKYPSIKGINFDLAAIVDKSPSYPGMSPKVSNDNLLYFSRRNSVLINLIVVKLTLVIF